jgi:hypothetical protein
MHDQPLSWLGTDTSNKKSGRVKLVLWACPLSEMMWSCKYFPRVSKEPTLTYNLANSVIIKNIMHNI